MSEGEVQISVPSLSRVQTKDLEALSVIEAGELLFDVDREYYEEKPVGIDEFISSDEFLAQPLQGEFWPFWREKLMQIYPTPFYSPFYEIIAVLPIGAGKSFTAMVSLVYDVYRLLCLKDPQEYYDIRPRGVGIAVVLINASKTLAGDVDWAIVSSFINECPWFVERGYQVPQTPDEGMMTVGKSVGFVSGSVVRHTMGRAVFGGAMDEANFQGGRKSDTAGATYNSLLRRMESRFMQYGGVIPGNLWLVSSPSYATDFLSKRLELSQTVKRTFRIVDTPIWEVQAHKKIWCGRSFKVFIGDERFDPRILDDKETTKEINHARVYDVPIEYHDSFQKSLVDAIRDIIGATSGSKAKIFNMKNLLDLAMSMQAPFTRDDVVLDFFDEKSQVRDFMKMEYFKAPSNPNWPRFMHVDIGITNDRLGIGACYVIPETRVISSGGVETVKVLDRRFYVDIALGIRRKQGQEIPLDKICDFILLLRAIGYPIKMVTFDGFQSRHMRQRLVLRGVEVGYLSVDADRGPYISLKNSVYSGKALLPKSEILRKELLELEDNGLKIDHPGGGSKDIADGVCGAYWAAFEAKNVTPSILNMEEQREGVSSFHQQMVETAERQREEAMLNRIMPLR